MRAVFYIVIAMIGLLILPSGGTLSGQDIHFTNFRLAPLSVNPSLTGAFRGTYRISGIYRDQWRSVDNSNPYKTPFASAELNIAKGLLLDHDWVAGGISFLRDQSGTLNFRNQMTALNIGYHMGMDKDYKNVFSVGVTYGSMTRGVDLQGITGDVLANTPIGTDGRPVPIFTGGGAAGETQRTTSFNSLSIGASYKTELEDGTLVRFGVNAAHLLGSDASLFNTARRDSTGGGGVINPPNNPNEKKDPFGPKIIIHGESSFLVNEKVRVNPALLFQTQAGFTELALQSTADYMLSREKELIAIGGLGYRFGDAFELMGGVQFKNVKVMLSYDLTTSSFLEAGGGAFELGVGYVGTIFKNPNVKPVIFCPRL